METSLQGVKIEVVIHKGFMSWRKRDNFPFRGDFLVQIEAFIHGCTYLFYRMLSKMNDQ